jgi:hypothetical protein
MKISPFAGQTLQLGAEAVVRCKRTYRNAADNRMLTGGMGYFRQFR